MYRVIVQDEAKPAVAALPVASLDSLAEAVDPLELDPWSGRPCRDDNPDGNIRMLPFGLAGLVTYMILDRDQEVHIIEVIWLG